MIPFAVSYAAWLPALLGFGLWLVRVRARLAPGVDPSDLLCVTIAGLATLAAVAVGLNFVVRIAPLVALGLLVLGWLLAVLQRRSLQRLAAGWPLPRLALALGLVLVGLLASYLASTSPPMYDSGLYHLQAVQWTTSVPLPLGLANLHGRLGYNSLWFPLAGVLETPWMEGRGGLLLNGTLFALYGLTVWGAALHWLTQGPRPSTIFLAATALAWPSVVPLRTLSSASPDLPVMLLSFLSVFACLRVVEGGSDWRYYLLLAAGAGVLGVTVKLSAAPLLLAPAIVGCWRLSRPSLASETTQSAARLSMLGWGCGLGVLALLWLARGVAQSGCLVYPVSLTCLPWLSWATPLRDVQADALWIASWARRPGLPPEAVLSDWGWLPVWLARLGADGIARRMAGALCLGLVLAGGAAAWGRAPSVRWGTYLVAGLTPLLGAVYWFATAPDLRFGLGYLWSLSLLALASGAEALDQVARLSERLASSRLARAGALAAILGAGVIMAVRYAGPLVQPPLLSWPPVGSPALVERRTDQGASVYSPLGDDRCWRAPLPCTPYFRPNLVILFDTLGRPREFRLPG